MKTDEEIKDIIYSLINGSELHKEAESKGGDLYTDQRPTNSGKEDIVISVLTGLNMGDTQEIIVNVNYYVPDITRASDTVENRQRIRRLSRIAMDLFERYVSASFLFAIESQTVLKVDEVSEHCINNRISLTHIN